MEELIADTGFEPTYLGPIRYARNLEVRVLLDGYREEQGPGAQQPASLPLGQICMASMNLPQGMSIRPSQNRPCPHACKCPYCVAQALAELWIHLGVLPAGFTQQTYGNLFSFQLQRKVQTQV